jgi:hypothetical protein
MIPGEICYKVCRLATTDPCLADPLGNLLSLLQTTKTYPYDTYHNYDTTLVTLGSALAHFSTEERSLFFVEGLPSHPCRWG